MGKTLLNMIRKNDLLNLWLENSEEGFILCSDKDTILFCNTQVRTLLDIGGTISLTTLKDLFMEDEILTLKKDGWLNVRKSDNNVQVRLLAKDKYNLVFMGSKDKGLIEQLDKVIQLNKELQSIFEQYADETIYIADNKGITLQVGEGIAANCGVTPNYLIGKNVKDLEKEGLFNPSVTLKVLESKQPEVVIQRYQEWKKLYFFRHAYI